MTPFSKLNRHEFIQYWMKQDTSGNRRLELIFIAAYIGGMALFAIPLRMVDFNEHVPVAIGWFVAFFGYLIVFPFIGQRVLGGPQRAEFHRCPSCSKPLMGANRLVVVATSRCGICAETILEDSALTTSSQP